MRGFRSTTRPLVMLLEGVQRMSHTVVLFPKPMEMLFGYFDPVHILFFNKMNNFRGDTIDVPAKQCWMLACMSVQSGCV